MVSKKHAILISNSVYSIPDFNLDTPNNDIAAIKESVVKRGFSVDEYYNVNASDFDDIFNTLPTSTIGDFILIYYAGHAIEINGQGYLLPIDLPNFSPFMVASYAYPVDGILKVINSSDNIKIIVLDSCRSTVPSWTSQDFSSFADIVGHVPDIMNYQNVVIAYSTSSGDIAYDGEGMSCYARSFSEQMLRHRISIDDVFKNVGALVTKTPPHSQRPWYYSSLNEKLTFSDLPEYHYIHTIKIPLSGIVSNLYYLNGHQVVLGGKTAAYSLNGMEYQPLVSIKTEIIGLDHSDSIGYVLVTSDGGVVSNSFSYAPNFDFNCFNCIKISPSGRYTALIGSEEIVVVYNFVKKAKRITAIRDNYYTAFFINDTTLWVGTCHGIKVVSITNESVVDNDVVLKHALYIYCIERVNSGTIALSCSDGKVYFVNEADLNIIDEICLGESVRTVSARRDSIINITSDNETINKFIYRPWLLEKDALDLLRGHLGGNDIIYIKHSPVDPILIAASDEGIVYFIDSRDFSMYHSINVGSMNHKIQGLSFETDGTILILTADSNVHYYSRGEADYRQAIKYIDDLHGKNTEPS